ncbi:MAG: UDP-N-acetylmuramoyl-tripeptide--D-alanyl-D-alanine ligase [Clostridia bacterium]|nr:UDP-N-acetylmuramoyl-tripeptide--D-alanyl-D-alanine ligase [Clostridia bacterium]
MNFSLEYICGGCGGKLSPSANKNRIINGFFSDSRTPDESKLFLALRGERVDGNSFVSELLSKGIAVITDREENLLIGGDCILVSDVREALQLFSANYRKDVLSGTPIIGVTGSVGKTTTKDMIAAALSSEKTVHKTLGNSNSQIGLPQTVLATPSDIDCAVIELGMSMPGEMERIAACAMPNISVITNIGYSHIENLGSREAIRDEKLKIAAFSPKGSVLILNGDEPLLKNYDYPDNKVIFVSTENDNCDCFATDVIVSQSGIDFTAVIFGKEIKVSLAVQGKHYVINSLFALAVAHCLGISLDSAANALSNYKSDGKRQFVYEKDGHTVISDCYNASPESMEAALSVLSAYNGRRIAVLGDMLELGNESDSLHKRVGRFVKGKADVLFTYGSLAKQIAAEADGVESYSFEREDAEKLKTFLEAFIKEGDVVLYKASNSMNLGRLIV